MVYSLIKSLGLSIKGGSCSKDEDQQSTTNRRHRASTDRTERADGELRGRTEEPVASSRSPRANDHHRTVGTVGITSNRGPTITCGCGQQAPVTQR